ncbi:alpha/beta fold hydrolase [Candidatus Venteria ishoeyi]|uniref:esterase/lipase family protein n=1 Tax=Candidatus Venteria ishoeyi TaxID=1899563 RepID=UPI0025A4F387|nr:alpha/beta fold hydrolase [Candidatus Venteria ishoeyi]MDM8545813.1 alpha/beta fold hydrolase [Candidatus Venteria ishoeyi]
MSQIRFIFRSVSIMLCFLLLSTASRADVLVLVHGYLGSPQSWVDSGVIPVLEQHGWRTNGILTASPNGVTQLPAQLKNKINNQIYPVKLPATAPIALQADLLNKMLQFIQQQHPQEDLSIAAHSAGGVVARMALIQKDSPKIKRLITIAAPHLGTSRAEQALNVSHSPFPLNLLTDLVAAPEMDLLRHSSGLLVDLSRPRPGNLLFWLNQQPHPDMQYYSLVRGDAFALYGDDLVQAYSQDMNLVPALQGRSTRIVAPGAHSMNPQDGLLLLQVLKS